MSLSSQVEKKAPKESWWAKHKTRAGFNAELETRLPEMPDLGSNITMGAGTTTGAVIAKRRCRDANTSRSR